MAGDLRLIHRVFSVEPPPGQYSVGDNSPHLPPALTKCSHWSGHVRRGDAHRRIHHRSCRCEDDSGPHWGGITITAAAYYAERVPPRLDACERPAGKDVDGISDPNLASQAASDYQVN